MVVVVVAFEKQNTFTILPTNDSFITSRELAGRINTVQAEMGVGGGRREKLCLHNLHNKM